ncbi:MAG: ABC transporter ATP-binding protein [Aquincola sp.]|nr:ABC transporter ATP-binding protein [Aquincola sp.]MDH4287278.1 ABC transporter ATP-binding protein [Aquincola sp.]MDH5329417.1 ABC transporter ATP-binding protein [Aquincola sp.]
MAQIHLRALRHSYRARPRDEVMADWALRELNLDWRNGGAYALLGPSGCGKSTLLNIVSGLLRPTHGQVLFDERDVTGLEPGERNIAQVFQFPVVYDTMTVADNLAFPLRNRGLPEPQVRSRVREIAALLDLEATLDQRAAGLTADGKQKISLGRGLVRADVAAILFDEPLTVIDPHLKWRLRSKLKELHQRLGVTMIYVTHDQTEALTFADQVVVMDNGQVVQAGTPVELFERPRHTFVGHFIGSPGMNLLPCEIDAAGVARFDGHAVPTAVADASAARGKLTQIGVRPEHLRFARAGETGLPVAIERTSDLGRVTVVDARHGEQLIKVLVAEAGHLPSRDASLVFDMRHTQVYADGWIVE